MIRLLARKLIRDHDNVGDPAVRRAYGVLCGAVGIALNLLLFAGKFLAGLLSGSIAITADAFNNLSDAGSSVVTLLGFKLAAQKPDSHHPFGHGRMEYVSGLVVSMVILLMGVELGKSSIEKILHPQVTQLTALSGTILVVSILVKLWMGWFNSKLGNRIQSETLRATAIDSRSDALATSTVLLGLGITHVTSLQLDGWLGLLVAAFILKAGWSAAKDTIDPLLGTTPDPEMVKEIQEVILSHAQVVGIHDLIIHDYGPGRRMMSVHAEVSDQTDVMEAHDIIDHIERELGERFQIESVIHMDPVQTGNPQVEQLRALTAQLARNIHPDLSIHDFRMTMGPMYTNLIFDLVVPYSVTMPPVQAKDALVQALQAENSNYHAVIHIDRSYVV